MASQPELPEDEKAADDFARQAKETQPPAARIAAAVERAADEFARQAKEKQPGVVLEFIDFLAHNKKWWLTPIVVMMLLLLLLVFLMYAMPGAAPFIYTLY